MVILLAKHISPVLVARRQAGLSAVNGAAFLSQAKFGHHLFVATKVRYLQGQPIFLRLEGLLSPCEGRNYLRSQVTRVSAGLHFCGPLQGSEFRPQPERAGVNHIQSVLAKYFRMEMIGSLINVVAHGRVTGGLVVDD